jgi:hypothetical protein
MAPNTLVKLTDNYAAWPARGPRVLLRKDQRVRYVRCRAYGRAEVRDAAGACHIVPGAMLVLVRVKGKVIA